MALQSRLPEIIAALDPAVHAATIAGGEMVAEDAKRRVPVVTGDLRDAIPVETTPEGAAVIAGDNKVFWGNFVEHGTATGAAPHPFLIPALEDNRQSIEQVVADAIRRESE